MTVLDDVATYVVANTTHTLGGTTGTLAKAVMLDTQPDTVAVLYETGGLGSVQSFSTSNPVTIEYEQPSFQLISRSTSYVVAENAADTVYALLDGLGLTTLGASTYLSIDAQQRPFSLGRDDSERFLISVNFQSKRRRPLGSAMSVGDSFDASFDASFS